MVFLDNVIFLVTNSHQQDQQEQIVPKITKEIVKDEVSFPSSIIFVKQKVAD